MCTACATLPEPAAIAERPDGPLRLSAEERRILAETRPAGWPSRAEIRATFLAWNASLPVPHRLCPKCEGILDPAETHPLLPDICGCCSADRIDQLLMRLATARGRKQVRKALKSLERLRRNVR